MLKVPTRAILSDASSSLNTGLPPARRGPGFQTIRVASYSNFPSHTEECVEVPIYSDSREYLQFLGFADHVVIGQIWSAALVCEQPLIVAAIKHVLEKADKLDAAGPSDDWDAALRHFGISDDLRRRLTNPVFDAIRFTHSASYWVLDTFCQAGQFLVTLEDSILCKADRDQRKEPVAHLLPPPSKIDGRTFYYHGGFESNMLPSLFGGRLDLSGLGYIGFKSIYEPELMESVYLSQHQSMARFRAWWLETRFPLSKAMIFRIAVPDDLCFAIKEHNDKAFWHECVVEHPLHQDLISSQCQDFAWYGTCSIFPGIKSKL